MSDSTLALLLDVAGCTNRTIRGAVFFLALLVSHVVREWRSLGRGSWGVLLDMWRGFVGSNV